MVLTLYLQSNKGDQRSGPDPGRSQLYTSWHNADDVVQTAASEGELVDIMNVWQAAFNKYHLQLNILQTGVMMMGRSHQIVNINIGDHTLNQVQSCKYLGSAVNEQSIQEEEQIIYQTILSMFVYLEVNAGL